MKIREMMSSIAYQCSPEQTLREVLHAFAAHSLVEVPVVYADGSLAGMINHTRLMQAIDEGMDFNMPIEKIMTRDLVSAAPDAEWDNIHSASAQGIPVVDEGRIIGIVVPPDNQTDGNLFDIIHAAPIPAMLNSIHDSMVIINCSQQLVFINNAAERIFGLKQEQVLGRAYRDIFPEGRLHEVLETENADTQHKTTCRGKTYVSLCSPISIQGQVIGAVEALQDISPIENISHELEYTKKLKDEMDAIIEASFDSIFVTDATGFVLSVNEAYTRITGIEAEEIIGKNMYDLVEQGLYDRSATIMVIETHQPITFTQKIKTGKTLLVTGNPIFDEKGELVRVLTNGRDITELNRLKQEVEQAYSLSKHYEEELKKATMSSQQMVIYSEKSKEIFDLIVRVAKVDSTVLVYGESGVGKELIMRELHNNSPRKNKPFLSINCAAIPESLLESELFGYNSGAFSGARKEGKMGIFELANGGTLCLDEIGELPLTLQAKLLRAIQEKEISRVGGTSSVHVDVRIITATNRDLWDMVTKRQFREDLYYRLHVVPISVPPLRERKEEIPALVFHFLKTFNEKYGMNKILDERLMAAFMDYHWPGNVRELKNVIERAVVTSSESVISSIRLEGSVDGTGGEYLGYFEGLPNIELRERVSLYEKKLIQQYVDAYKTSRRAAEALGVSQTTIVRKAAQYGIDLGSKQ